jgi:CpeT protein
MIDKFCNWFEGEYNNQRQAFENPTRFAMIEIFHEKIGELSFSITQQYMVDKVPYRKAIIEVIQLDELNLILKNYREDLTPLPGCDIMVSYSPENDEFVGGIQGTECIVPWSQNGQIIQTYLSTQFILSELSYKVQDKGYDNQGNRVWGSEHGFFNFIKQSSNQFKLPQ